MTCEKHEWEATGKHGVHVEHPTKTRGRKVVYAHYVRCAKCQQDGFIRPGVNHIVFTWSRDSVAD